jgi:1-acyl-sn-glycerol-3-phosphate acyltransferase
MRTLLAFPVLLLATFFFGGLVLLATLLRVPYREGGLYDKAPGWWARTLLWASGVKVRLHGTEQVVVGEPRIYVCNHVSWYDVLALAVSLPRYKFIGKAELVRIPLFGPAAAATGLIPIERENRKAAFESYRLAAKQIRGGMSVVVYPEGTRGESYRLRGFKKGPFVLAIEAGVPIVPTIIHGTIEVLPRGSLYLQSGTVDIHFLDPVPTQGLTYDDRDTLSREVWQRMATAMREKYDVESCAEKVPAAM